MNAESADGVEARLYECVLRHSDTVFWLHRHPWAALEALRLVRQLPTMYCSPTDTTEGMMIRAELGRTSLGISTPIHQASTVLELPRAPGGYNIGRARATQRRKARAATRAGVSWRVIDDPLEQAELLRLADDWERVNPRPQYRNSRPDNADLPDVGLWLVAFHEDRPILLSVTAVDGDWALLRYFRTLIDSEAASTSRYLMTEVLAEHLGGRGVRYLCDAVSPLRLPPGLHHFARMVGFRIRRIRCV